MRRLEHVARKGEIKNSYRDFVGETESENHLDDLGVDGRIILEWFLGK
jgi:hypothetical protein